MCRKEGKWSVRRGISLPRSLGNNTQLMGLFTTPESPRGRHFFHSSPCSQPSDPTLHPADHRLSSSVMATAFFGRV